MHVESLGVLLNITTTVNVSRGFDISAKLKADLTVFSSSYEMYSKRCSLQSQLLGCLSKSISNVKNILTTALWLLSEFKQMSQVKFIFARAVPKQTQIYDHTEKNIFTFEMLELLLVV